MIRLTLALFAFLKSRLVFPSRQRKHGGGKFKSERQRRAMWANAPSAAKAWAHNRKTKKSDWRGMRKTRRSH